MNELDNQDSSKPLRDEKGRLLPGNSGNLKGRPKGQSLKEYWRQRFVNMTDEEKVAFTEKVGNEGIWRMAEGNPAQDTDITSKGERIMVLPATLIDKNDINSNTGNSSEGQTSL